MNSSKNDREILLLANHHVITNRILELIGIDPNPYEFDKNRDEINTEFFSGSYVGLNTPKDKDLKSALQEAEQNTHNTIVQQLAECYKHLDKVQENPISK